MTKITTGKVCDPRGVNSPAHYNTHESGVEAIEVCRFMNFNVGSAFKYVYRRGDKVEPYMTPAQAIQKDLDKALWYIHDEIENCWDVPVFDYGASGGGRGALALVADSEPQEDAKTVYKAFVGLGDTYTPDAYLKALEALEVALLNLKEYEHNAV